MRPSVPRGWTPALLALAAGLLALGLLFRAEAQAAVRVWIDSRTYGHCFLVGPIAAWLAWERRDALRGLAPAPVVWLAALAVPLGAAWFGAWLLGVMEWRQFAALFLVWLLAFSVLGFRVGRAMAVPLAYLVFLVPFGAFLTPALQDFTTRFIEVFLVLLGIPHVVTDTLIEIPEGHFRVAEACAGLRFLIAAIAFGALYACVIYRDAGRRLAFIAVCVVVPVLANGVRALGIVLLGHVRGSAAAGAVDHVLYGWIFFSLVILLLLALGLPFRQDSFAPTALAPPPAAPAWRWGAALAAGAVALLAAAGPAAAFVLGFAARAETAALAARAESLAAALVIPPGCAAEPAIAATRRVVCDGVALEVRTKMFGGRDGPAALAAWRDAADAGDAEDSQTLWLDAPGARWRVIVARDPDRIFASALWLGGAPAPGGLDLRLRLARAGLAGGEPLALATVAAAGDAQAGDAQAGDAARATVERFMALQRPGLQESGL